VAEPAAAATATPESPGVAAQAAIQPEETAAAPGGTVKPQASTGDEQLAQQLEEVRALYWARDLRGAAAGYQSLGQAYPDNADVWGEIGNFYYSLRQAGPATNAYSRAIELLVQQGDKPRARQLLDVLYRLDASAARELETRLQQTGS
jgi:tetratricopeptide (TPR) repeat protein